MERDFRYLREKYGDAGAREAFEKICVEIFQKLYKDAYPVKASPGDDGIDILVGEFTEPLIVFQCKYFVDGIHESQKAQIRKSYKTVTDKYKVKEWNLCVPLVFTINDHQWWSDWKSSKCNKGITIGLYDESRLINTLKEYDLYNRIFDEDIRNMLGDCIDGLRQISDGRESLNIKKSGFKIGDYYKLPMKSKLFKGRLSELEKLSKGFENNRISVLYGVTGIGKSQIAKQFLYLHKEQYRKIYWIFASTKDELFREYQQIAKVNNLPICNDDEKDLVIELVKNHFEKEENSLIIYDGLDDMNIFEIKNFLPNGALNILITTQNSNWDPNEVTVVEVKFMEKQDAIDFIINNTSDRKHSRDDNIYVKQLVEELSYYPLGLEYARAYLNARNITIEEYIDIFNKYRFNLFYSTCSDYRMTALNAWKMSFDKIYEKEVNAYDFMALCSFMGNEHIAYHDIFENVKYDMLKLEKIVDILKQYSMVNIIHKYVEFHSVTQEFMRHQLNDKNEYNKYLLECLQLLRTIFPNSINNCTERDKAIAILPHIEATFYYLPDQVDDNIIFEVGVDISTILYKMGLLKKSLEINEKILSYALKMKDYAKYADTLNAIAISAHYCGYTEKGLEHVDEAIKELDRISDVDIKEIYGLKSSIYGNKGIMLKNLQQFSGALDSFAKALDYAKKSESQTLICNQLMNLAIVNRHTGKLEKAEEFLLEAQKYCGNNIGLEAKIYGNIGFLYEYKDYNKALYYFAISLEKSREINDQKTVCTNLNHMGTCYMNLKKSDESYEYFVEANKLAMEINLQQAVIHSHNNLGKWYFEFKRDIKNAIINYEKAYNLSSSIKYADGIQAAESGLIFLKNLQ